MPKEKREGSLSNEKPPLKRTRIPPIYKALVIGHDEEARADHEAMLAWLDREDSLFKGKVTAHFGADC